MVIQVSSTEAGAWLQQSTTKIHQLNKSAVAIAKGDVLYLDTSDNNYKPTTNLITTAPAWAVAVQDALSTDTKVLACTKGLVAVKAEGVINPHRAVIASSTGAKMVKEGGATPAVNTMIGRYAGKATNNISDGLSLAACADGDIVFIDLNGAEV